MKFPIPLLACSVMLFLFGCVSSGQKPERGPAGTIAYYIDIESSESGARVEVNGEHMGSTPTKVKVFGDKDGTFHDFGANEFAIKVYPIRAGQRAQTRIFRTGRWFSQEDRIPKRLYFDLNEKTEGFSIDLPSTKETKP